MTNIRAFSATSLASLVLAAALWSVLSVALADRNVTRTNVNRNVNTNRNTNVNVNRNVNRNVNVNTSRHVDVDVDVDRHGHPWATAAAVTTAAVVTSAIIGSTVRTLPPACSVVLVNGIAYQSCGGAWYQPQYVGTSVQYVVVTAPR